MSDSSIWSAQGGFLEMPKNYTEHPLFKQLQSLVEAPVLQDVKVDLRGKTIDMNGFLLCLISPTLRQTLCEPKGPGSERRVVLDDVEEDAFRKVVGLACCKPGAHASGPEEVFALANLAGRLGVFAVRDAMTDAAMEAQAIIAQATAELAAKKAEADLAAARAAAELAEQDVKRQLAELQVAKLTAEAKAEAEIVAARRAAEVAAEQAKADQAAADAARAAQQRLAEEASLARARAEKEALRMSEELARARKALEEEAANAAKELASARAEAEAREHKAQADLRAVQAESDLAAAKAAAELAKARAAAELTAAHVAELAAAHAAELQRRAALDAAEAQVAADYARALADAAQAAAANAAEDDQPGRPSPGREGLRLGGRVAAGLGVSPDALVLTHDGAGGGGDHLGVAWRGAIVEREVDTAGRCYAEWVLEDVGSLAHVMLGVTALAAAPPDGGLCVSPESRMFYCHDARAWPGNRAWGPEAQCKRGDRVGILVHAGSVSVFVNGARLGAGPMATDLPPRVRFAADLCRPGARIRIDPAAPAPAAP